MPELLRAVGWRNDTTFTRLYWRDEGPEVLRPVGLPGTP
jgi:hypothetical protein